MPSTQIVHGGGNTPTLTQRVYYTGSDTLYEGYALCYNFDATEVSPENLSISLTQDAAASDPLPARVIQVEKPSYANAMHFAGVVSGKDAGKKGPCWVEIFMPGSVCNIYAAADVDHADSNNVATGQILTFSTGQYYFKYAGLPGEGSAIVLQDVNRSATNGLVMAKLMTGVPSGGYNTVVSTQMSAGGAVSEGGEITKFPPAGVTAITVPGVASTMTLLLQDGHGEWIGQQKVFKTIDNLSTNTWQVSISAGRDATVATINVTSTDVVASLGTAAGEYIHCTFDGGRWNVVPSISGIV